MAGEASTPETRAKLAERLRAMAVEAQTQPDGGDATLAKFIFDLRHAGALIDGLEELLELILVKMLTATNRDLAADGAVGDEEGVVWGEIEKLAAEIRESLDGFNPEPKVAS